MEKTLRYYENLVFINMAKQEKSIRALKEASLKYGDIPLIELQDVEYDARELFSSIEHYRMRRNETLDKAE